LQCHVADEGDELDLLVEPGRPVLLHSQSK